MKEITRVDLALPKLMRRKRVAAYARVSMPSESTERSLDAQVNRFSALIQRNPEWEYAGVYADNGISGTGTKRRIAFQRMLADCEAGKIDLILAKSISRFARNTVDLLNTVRHLKEMGIAVYFERERINTLSAGGELMLTLLASFAQEESRSISENVRWSIKKRFEKGISATRSWRTYGYRWEGEQMVVVPQEAELVRFVYKRYLEGAVPADIAEELNELGAVTVRGGSFEKSGVERILANAHYTGILILQKWFLDEDVRRKSHRNRGEKPQYIVENDHEAIIDKETFDKAQAERKRRCGLLPDSVRPPLPDCWQGKVQCGSCGSICEAHWHQTKEFTGWSWRCVSPNCRAKGVSETELEQAVLKVLSLEHFDESALHGVESVTIQADDKLDFKLAGRKRICSVQHEQAHLCFTGKLLCGICGRHYVRRLVRRRLVPDRHCWWCESREPRKTMERLHITKVIDEQELLAVTIRGLGLIEFDDNAFCEQVKCITVFDNRFVYELSDGSVKEVARRER